MYVTVSGQKLSLSVAPDSWPTATTGSSIRNGTTKNDYLRGISGQTLVGGAGDDSYVLTDASISIVEQAGQGVDTVYVDYRGATTLANNVENLILRAKGATAGTGNTLANIIISGVSGATLDGGAGEDVLVGGSGADVFKVRAGNGSDAIYGFTPGWDIVSLSGYGITSFTQLMGIARQDGTDVRFHFANGEALVLRDVSVENLRAADFGLPMDIVIAPDHFLMTGASAAYNINGWFVLNNAWGSSALKQGVDYTISSSLSFADMTSETTFNWSYAAVTELYPSIRAYPEVIFGVAPMGGGSNPTDTAKVFPLQVSAMVSVLADFDVSHSGNMAGHNIAYDIWLTDTPYGGPDSMTNEIMVWLYKGSFDAYGDLIGTYRDGDFTAKIYHTGTYTAIVSDQEWLSGTLDIGKIIATLVEMGIVSKEEYLASVELGAEVVSGNGSLTIHNLDLHVESLNADGSVTVKEVTGAGTSVSTRLPEEALGLEAAEGVRAEDGSVRIVIDENSQAVTVLGTTEGQHAGAVRYSITGGADAGRFVIDGTSGSLIFAAATDYERPGDADGDNIYHVVVSASDGSITETLDLEVGIRDVNEAPVALASQSLTVAQGRASSLVSLGVSDPEGDGLSYSLAEGSGPQLGSIAFDPASGGFVYTAGSKTGEDSFVVVIRDSHGNSICQTVMVSLVPQEYAGTSGADLIAGSDGSDIIHGGAGDDVLRGGWGRDVLYGGDGADILDGGGDAGQLFGGAGNDALYGGGSNDILDGGIGADWMAGGQGSDTYNVDDANDVVIEYAGGGRDVVITSIDYRLGANVEDLVLTDGAGLTGYGNELGNKITGGNGNDRIFGGGGMDFLFGGAGDDYLSGDDGNDALNGEAGHDHLLGGQGNDTLSGGIGNDRLEGGAGSDSLFGDDGNDLIFGGVDNDFIMGGAGADRLYGGAGTDIFRYFSIDDSRVDTFDRIEDFSSRELDRLDLRGMDAIAGTAADDAFAFIGQDAFTGSAGQLRYELAGGDTRVMGDVNGDQVADFMIVLTGTMTLAAWNFQL